MKYKLLLITINTYFNKPSRDKLFIQLLLFAFTLPLFILTSYAATINIQQNDFELHATGLGQGHASVAMLNNGTSLMVWQEQGTQALVIDNLGNTLARLSISNPTGSAGHPIVSAGTGRFVVTWQERTSLGHEVFITILDNAGNTLVAKKSITLGNQPWISDTVIHPDVAMNKKGEFIVVWDVLQSGKRVIYSQSFNRIAQSTSPVTMLSTRPSLVLDPTSKIELGFPDVDINIKGDVAVVWGGYDVITASYPIALRKFNIHISPWVNTDEQLLDYVPGAIQARPNISLNNKGDIVASWMDITASTMNTASVFYKKYNKTLNTWKNTIRLAGELDTGANRITSEIFQSGTSIIAFSGKSLDGSLDVYISFYSPRNKLLEAFKVNDNNSSLVTFEQRRPAIAFSSGSLTVDLMLTWEMAIIGGSDIVYGKKYRITR
jgi:hypothetical protein